MRLSLKTKITTPKMDDTAAFYRRVFDMQVAEEWDEEDDRGVILAFTDSREEAYLEIYDGDVVPDFSSLSLQFKVDDLAGFKAALPVDIESNGPIARPWGSSYLYLRDPNGVQVIVYEGGL